MLNYSVIFVKEKNVHVVFENKTEHFIKEFSSKKEAKNYAKNLNLGFGFDGWTPSFVLKKVC